MNAEFLKNVIIDEIIDIVETEEEFNGDIPAHLFAKITSSPEAAAEALRIAVFVTKQNIKRRIKEFYENY
jgi:hypothetical protein